LNAAKARFLSLKIESSAKIKANMRINEGKSVGIELPR
jgi:hypothetical protein